MYRPEGWKETKEQIPLPQNISNPLVFMDGLIEAGADAMLEALREKGARVYNMGEPPLGKGVVIFIPNEEQS